MATIRQTHEVTCEDEKEFDQFVKQLDEYRDDASNAPIEMVSSDRETLTIVYRALGEQKSREKQAEEVAALNAAEAGNRGP